MKPELRARILNYNRAAAENRERAADLMTLLEALPPGQVKNLMKEAGCAAILKKYGIGVEP